MRIKARAIQRAGQLLELIDRPEHSGRPKINGVGAHPISKRQAALGAGMSKNQQRDATRVARVDQDEFDSQVDSDNPPTVSALARRGKNYGRSVTSKFGWQKRERICCALSLKLMDLKALTHGTR